jgi:hypothetical protein
VIRLCDSYYQTGTDFGKPDPVFSYAPEISNYYISDILFERTTDADCVWIDGSSNVVFERCHFIGRKSLISAESNDNTPIVDTGSSNVRLRGISFSDLTPAKNIVFNNCTFKSAAVGIRIDNQTYGTTVVGSYFNYLHRGITIGENSGGRDSPATTLYPRTVSVSGSYFDRIGSQAIQGYEDSGPVLSTGNTYENVGYRGNTYDELLDDVFLSPVSAVLEFAVNGSSSVNDSFYRTYRNTQNRRYEMRGTPTSQGLSVIKDNGFSSIYLNGEEGLQMGRMVQTTGHTAILADATAVPTVVVNEINGNVRIDGPGTITYVALRDDDYRTGSLRVTWNDVSGVVLYDDEYTESSDIGLTFSARYHDGGNHTPVEILYTTTDTNIDIDLQYSIKYHTANNSPR